MSQQTKALTTQTPPKTAETALKQLSKIQDKSLVKSLSDIACLTDAVLTEEDARRVNRFISRLAQIGHVHVANRLLRCRRAELAHQLRLEEDYTLFINPETGKRYESWLDFRPTLATALNVAVSTLAEHISLVRVGKEVLKFEEGDFTRFDGLTTVRHLKELCDGLDGRTSDDFSLTVRPKTTKFAERLEADFQSDDGWAGCLRRYYFEERIYHDLSDPDAINRPISELSSKAREELGAPEIIVHYAMVGQKVAGYRVRVIYPDTEDAIGVEEDFVLNYADEWVPSVVRDEIDKRLRVR